MFVQILMLVASSQAMADARATEYCDGRPHAFFTKFEEGQGSDQLTSFVCQKAFPKSLPAGAIMDAIVIPVEAEKQDLP